MEKSWYTGKKGRLICFSGNSLFLIADETATGVSGCSTDSSVRLIKDIEQRFSINMFDRTMLAFVVKDKVQLLPLSQLQYAVDNGFITTILCTLIILCRQREELENKWIVPVKDSWLAKRISERQER